MHKFTFIDLISHLEWSPDSNYILVGIAKRSVAFVKSLTDNDWACKIDEGLAGLVYCRWASDSKHVLTVSDFKVRMTVWSIIDKSVQYIKNPKHESKGVSFSPSGKLMALAERTQDSKDCVAIYDISTPTWICVLKFTTDTLDLEDIRFSKDGQQMIVWDSAISNKLLVY